MLRADRQRPAAAVRQQVRDAEEASHRRAARALEQGAGLVVLDDPALEHEGDGLPELRRLRAVVGDDDRGQLSALLQVHDDAAQCAAAVRVQRRQGLVEQQELWLGRERPGQRDALLLPARQALDPPITERRQAHLGKVLGRAGTAFTATDSGRPQR